MYRPFLEALETTKGVQREDHPNTLVAMAYLGNLFLGLDRADVAEPLFLRALEDQRRVLPDGHFETRWSMNSLANMYAGQERYEETKPFRRDVLETAERVLSAGDHRILRYQSAYGACLTKLERYPEAQEHLLVAYEGLTELPGQEEQRTKALQRLIELYEAGDVAEPEQGYAEKAADWRTKLEALDDESPESESESKEND